MPPHSTAPSLWIDSANTHHINHNHIPTPRKGKAPKVAPADPLVSFTKNITAVIEPNTRSSSFLEGVPGLGPWSIRGIVRITNQSDKKTKTVAGIKLAFKGSVETVVMDSSLDLWHDIKEVLGVEIRLGARMMEDCEGRPVSWVSRDGDGDSVSSGDSGGSSRKGIVIPPGQSVVYPFFFHFAAPEDGGPSNLPDTSCIGDKGGSRGTVHYLLEATIFSQGRLLGTQKRSFRTPVRFAWCPLAISSYLRRSTNPILTPTPKNWSMAVQDPRPGRFPSAMLTYNIHLSTTTLEPGHPFALCIQATTTPSSGIKVSKAQVMLEATARIRSSRTEAENRIRVSSLRWTQSASTSTEFTVPKTITCLVPSQQDISPSIEIPSRLTISYTLILRLVLEKTTMESFRLEDVVMECPVTMLGYGPREARKVIGPKWETGTGVVDVVDFVAQGGRRRVEVETQDAMGRTTLLRRGSDDPPPTPGGGRNLPRYEALPPAYQSTQYEATARFIPKLEDEIRLRVGDLVVVNEVMVDGWARGVNLRTGDTGCFPMGAVAVISS